MNNDELYAVAKVLSRQSYILRTNTALYAIRRMIYDNTKFYENMLFYLGYSFFKRYIDVYSRYVDVISPSEFISHLHHIDNVVCRSVDEIYDDLSLLSQDDSVLFFGSMNNSSHFFKIHLICPNVVYDTVEFGTIDVVIKHIFIKTHNQNSSYQPLSIELFSKRELLYLSKIYQTPHCRYNTLCVGHYSSTLTLLFRFGYFIEAIELLKRIVYTYNSEDAWLSIGAWKYGICSECGLILDNDRYCKYCGYDFDM